MGKLYEYCEQIEEHIQRNGLDVFKTRGALAMKCGFIISLITEDDPDDPEKLKALSDAAADVLGLQVR